jgi:hypothetical protein
MPIQVIRGAGKTKHNNISSNISSNINQNNKTKTKKTKTNNKTQSSKTKWPYIPLNTVNQLEAIAEYYNISHKARGLQKPTKSDEGFLTVYRNAKGDPAKFESNPVKKASPDGEKWAHHREDFCNRRYAMIKGKANYGLYDAKTGLPTVMHTNMLMWACSPDKDITRKTKGLLDKLEQVKNK